MSPQKHNLRPFLLFAFLSVLILNSCFVYLASSTPVKSDPARLEELTGKVEQDKIEITKEFFLSSLDSMKKYAIASDELVLSFQKLVVFFALSNSLVVVIILICIWRRTSTIGLLK